jgi:hypothetical protein
MALTPPPDLVPLVGVFSNFLKFSTITRNAHVASYTTFVYDWLLCLDQEVSLIRSPGFSPAKMAYLFCRWWPLLTYPFCLWAEVYDHPKPVCEAIFHIPTILVIFNSIGSGAVLILRVYAFSGGHKSVAAGLTVLMFTVVIYQMWVILARSQLIPISNACYPIDSGTAKHFSGYFLAPLLFDCIVTGVFMVYTIRLVKLRFAETSIFTKVFIREGLWYFIGVAVINAVNTYFNWQPNVAMADVIVPMSLLLPNVLACRLVINLRDAAASEGRAQNPLSLERSAQASAKKYGGSSTGGVTTHDDYALSHISVSASMNAPGFPSGHAAYPSGNYGQPPAQYQYQQRPPVHGQWQPAVPPKGTSYVPEF